jgi:Zn-dependent protease
MAEFDSIPRQPRRELLITIAGPAVNFVLAALLWLVLPSQVELESNVVTLADFGHLVLQWNLLMGVFNLLPAFPMDGGRVLRALLATRLSRLRATEIAVSVGTVVAGGFVVVGLWAPQYVLVAVAVVVWLLGQAELASVRARAAAKEWGDRVTDWFGPPAERSSPVSPGFSGQAWDTVRGKWVEYRNGRAVGVIDS